MGVFDNFKFVNAFSNPFKLNKKIEDKINDQLDKNSQGMSVTEFDLNTMGMGSPIVGAGYGSHTSQHIDFNQIFQNKRGRVAKYREMSYYPEISEALDIVSDEAIVQDPHGEIVHLNIKKEMPERVKKKLNAEFDHVTDNVLKVTDNLHGLFKKWLTEGELYVEWILNKGKNQIIGYKILPAFTTFPVYSDNGSIKGFIQTVVNDQGNQGVVGASSVVPTGSTTEKLITFESNQVSYTHWDAVGKNMLDIRGYLEATIRTYNQLKSLEDSLVVYRLVRAPERRVWNIEVGRLPNAKAQEFIKTIIHKYKRNHTYKTADGSVDSERNVQSLAEDFWFAKREGQGTNVETLASGMNLGELDDVKYFLSKMYKTLKLPKTRWSPEVQPSNYTTGRDIDREELKFSLFVTRAQNMFKKLIKDGFMEQIKFKYKKDPKMKKWLKPAYFDIKFTQANFFKEIKELELMETRLGILGTAISYVTNTDEPNNPLSMEFVLRRYFQMTDEEYNENEKLKKKERDLNREVQDEYGDSGDEEGGEETGGEEEPEDDNAENGNPNGLGGGLGSPDKETGQQKEPEEEAEEYSGKDNLHISKKAKDFLSKPRRKKRLL